MGGWTVDERVQTERKIRSRTEGFCHTVPIVFNGNFHGYYTRYRNDIRKSTASRKWGHWSSISFSLEIWNRLDPTIREAESLTAFKHGLSKAIL